MEKLDRTALKKASKVMVETLYPALKGNNLMTAAGLGDAAKIIEAYLEALPAREAAGDLAWSVVERIAMTLHEADDLGDRLHWGSTSLIGEKKREHYRRLAKAALSALPPAFDEISIDVSTGEHDSHVRAFASMPPLEIMEDKGKRIALFDGYLNDKSDPAPSMCPSCGGNDADMPCAYPREKMPGCPREERLRADDRLVQNLAMLVKRLARRLDNTEGHEDMVDSAMEFLKRHGLQGSLLRENVAVAAESEGA